MSLIRLIFVLGLFFSASVSAGYYAPKSTSSCNANQTTVCRLTVAEAKSDYASSWPWPAPVPAANGGGCGVFTLTAGPTWSGNTASFSYTSAWAPPPPNNTVSGTHTLGTCVFTCPTGQVDNGAGACVAQSCADKTGQVAQSGTYDIGPDPAPAYFVNFLETYTCISNCTVSYTPTNAWSWLVSGVRHYFTEGQFKYTGGSCTSSSGNTPNATGTSGAQANTCVSPQVAGYVNGVALCYTPATPPQAGATPPVTTQKSTATTANGDGSTTKTDTQTNPDGSKTITATTTQPNGNQSTTTQTIAPPDAQAAKDFCALNPTADVCKKQSECEKNPKAVGCAELGDNPTAEDIVTKSIPITFSEVSIPADATCPAPINLNIAGHSILIEYDGLCQFAAGIRPVFLAMAYLSAALIMMGGIRENA